ncbi:unnamed protein product [Callosobruchus maculatus]|uniref:Uncharacterized protein n=1 Tax=Callosobruchus maculatus TaxID=64391 RepID=A0A653CLA3_CALMS|nr:unnamed protein product [Callosobruchus maculatus]
MQFPGCRDLNALHATTPYGLCSIHRMQSCNCLQPIKVEHNNHRAIKSVGRCEVVQSFIYLGSLIDNSG